MDGGGKEGGMVGGISRPIQSTPGLPRKRGWGLAVLPGTEDMESSPPRRRGSGYFTYLSQRYHCRCESLSMSLALPIWIPAFAGMTGISCVNPFYQGNLGLKFMPLGNDPFKASER